METVPKKIKKNIFNMSVGSRHSTISGLSNHNSVYERQTSNPTTILQNNTNMTSDNNLINKI